MLRLAKLLLILLVPLVVAIAWPAPVSQSAQIEPAAGLQMTQPCGGGTTPDQAQPSGGSNLDQILACYEHNRELARKTLAPYASPAQGLLGQLDAFRQQLRAELGLGG